MELEEAFVYLEENIDWYIILQDICTKICLLQRNIRRNQRISERKMKNKTFSFYYSRKFADFAGLFMCFCNYIAWFCFTGYEKHTYELLLHTKPITAGKYVLGKVSAGFAICFDCSDYYKSIILGIVCYLYKRQ